MKAMVIKKVNGSVIDNNAVTFAVKSSVNCDRMDRVCWMCESFKACMFKTRTKALRKWKNYGKLRKEKHEFNA